MRVAIIGPRGVPGRDRGNIGGVESYMAETLPLMRKHQLSLYCRRWYAKKFGNGNAGSAKIKPVFTINTKSLDKPIYSLLASIRAAFGHYDIVHYYSTSSTLFCFLPKLMGKRVVVTVQGIEWMRTKWGKIGRLTLKLSERMAVKFADRIAVPTPGAAKYFKETYSVQCAYVPNGAPTIRRTAVKMIAENWGLEKDNFILFIGRFAKEKGIEVLIEAFKRIAVSAGNGLKLVLAGGTTAPNDKYAKKLRELARGVEVIFAGFVNGDRVGELVSNARALVVPSEIEGLPLILLGAMKLGTPCIASAIEPHKFVITDGQNGFLFNGVGELAEKITHVLRLNANEIAMISRNAAASMEAFKWEKTVAEIEKIYDELV